jgi:hypothetical protein
MFHRLAEQALYRQQNPDKPKIGRADALGIVQVEQVPAADQGL